MSAVQRIRPGFRQGAAVLDPAGFRRYNRGPLNEWDACLIEDRLDWDYLLQKGGLRTVCCPKGRRVYKSPPWITMPAEGRRFKPVGVLALAAITADTNQAVLQMTADTGYDGVITDIVCEATAPGATNFVEGSGMISWRLAANLRYLRNVGNIQTTMGSLTSPGVVPRGGWRIYSREVLTFYVNITAAAMALLNPNTNIICSFSGWQYPR